MYSQEEREKKNEKFFIMIVLIFITLIIIVFLLIRCLGFIDHKPRIPTGNIDIFDIIFQQNCNNNCNCNCNSCNNGNCGNCTNSNKCNNKNCNSNNNGNSNSFNGTTQPEEQSGIEVFDKETEYSHDTPLNIFTNTTYYVVDNKIAPLTENAYQFVIRNHNDFNIKYTLELNEENKYNINMKYRLKLNGVYVAGNDEKWLTYDELNQYNIGLAANTYDVYTLDWKWFESKNDTEVGTNINSNYKLGLKITASEY